MAPGPVQSCQLGLISSGFAQATCLILFCREGRYNLCPDIKFFATPPVHGSLANVSNADGKSYLLCKLADLSYLVSCLARSILCFDQHMPSLLQQNNLALPASTALLPCFLQWSMLLKRCNQKISIPTADVSQTAVHRSPSRVLLQAARGCQF